VCVCVCVVVDDSGGIDTLSCVVVMFVQDDRSPRV
jgi:hypothetical protein